MNKKQLKERNFKSKQIIKHLLDENIIDIEYFKDV